MTSNNEGPVSKRKEKRVKKDLRTFATQTIDDLFEKFYPAKVAEERAAHTLHQYKENLRISSITRILAEISIQLRLM